MSGFNGATALMPWKYGMECDYPSEEYELQWGHGFDAVEIGKGEVNWLMNLMKLQWGHGFDAVEIRIFV